MFFVIPKLLNGQSLQEALQGVLHATLLLQQCCCIQQVCSVGDRPKRGENEGKKEMMRFFYALFTGRSNMIVVWSSITLSTCRLP